MKRKNDKGDKIVTPKNAQVVARRVMITGLDYSLPQSDFNKAADLSIHLTTATATEGHLLFLRKMWEGS